MYLKSEPWDERIFSGLSLVNELLHQAGRFELVQLNPSCFYVQGFRGFDWILILADVVQCTASS